jgi:GTP-binding protein
MLPTIVIVGRPNVGKSTLFNRLSGKQLALVDDSPGVTRDRREGLARLGPAEFRIVDTAGLEDAFDDSLPARMRQQTEAAVADASVVLLVIDARAGVTPLDEHFANWLRRQPVPVVLVANKCEGRAGEQGRIEAYGLGLGDPVPLSAEHGEGLSLLFEALDPHLAAEAAAKVDVPVATGPLIEDDGLDEQVGPLQLAVVGRPNVGKSTLVNRLLGSERMLTGPEAGITRDAIAVEWEYDGRRVALVDTAGLRRRARVDSRLEKMSGAETIRAIKYAQVVALVLDGTVGDEHEPMLERQDLTIARHVVDEGRALIIIVNKWDVVDDRRIALQSLQRRLEISLPQARGVPIVALSALTGRNVERLMPAVIGAYDIWNRRISTGRLNDWLTAMLERHPPPLASNKRRIRLRYITQARTRPPTFVIFCNRPEDLPDSYLRYLENALRDDFGLDGVPIRIQLRKRNNPYKSE